MDQTIKLKRNFGELTKTGSNIVQAPQCTADMNIIPLQKKYLEETIKMVNEVFPADVNAMYSPEKSFRLSLEYEEEPELLNKSYMRRIGYWIMQDDTDEVIGVTGLYRRENDPSDLVWLGWYCVRADQRGKGLGRRLLEWTINIAREEGYKKLELYTSTDPNEARAQELYEKLGFKIVGEEKSGGAYKTLYREKIL